MANKKIVSKTRNNVIIERKSFMFFALIIFLLFLSDIIVGSIMSRQNGWISNEFFIIMITANLVVFTILFLMFIIKIEKK